MDLVNEYKAIFELNNKTPLLARVAYDEIESGNFENALSILESGIELFEEYPTLYFLKGNALLKLGKTDDARVAFLQGDSFLNNSETLNYYLTLLPSDDSSITDTKNGDDTTSKTSETQTVETELEDDLEELADKLKTAKIEIKHDDDLPQNNNTTESQGNEEFKPLKGLVSETLASIYFNQSNYKEAKAIYETLIEIQPERKEYFKNKLAEIDARMKS